MDRRIAKTVDGDATAYVYDLFLDDPLSHRDVSIEFSDRTLRRRWLHSNVIDETLAFEQYTSSTVPGSGVQYQLLQNRQGSVELVVDDTTSSIVGSYDYASFGERQIVTDMLPQRYGFMGREHDSESALIYFRGRHYDPLTGQFMQTDPIEFGGGTLNLREFVSNSPYNWSDPSGLAMISSRYKGTTIKGAAAAGSTANDIAQATLSMVEGILTDLMDAGLIDLDFPNATSPTCDRNGNDRRSNRTQRAYLVFSDQGVEKVGISGAGTRRDGVSNRAIRSMVQVKHALADAVGDFTGNLIVVMIKEIAGGTDARASMLNFERDVATAMDQLDQPMTCHVRPRPGR